MTTHYVKSWPHLFQAIVDGRKLHDLRRKSDRDYKVGDTLVLQEFDMIKGEYTGREQTALITYITSNDTPCAMSSMALDNDAVILSITTEVLFP